MARRRRGRSIDGVLLVDKPAGCSSNQLLQRMKRLYGAAKAGHTGALDPLATGMLPLCFGEATKFSQFLLDADKHYQATAKLGVITASDDADGEVLEERPVEGVTAEKVKALLQAHLSGEITQTPSMYSALKHEGQPLYKLARKGVEVAVKQRQVRVYSIELLDFRGDELDLDIHCSKGTYVRSIVADLGELLGCGAHVSVLRRLDAGPYTAEMMRTPAQIEALAEAASAESAADKSEENQQQGVHQALDTLLLPPWSAVDHLPKLQINDQQLQRVQHGNRVALEPGQAPRQAVPSAACNNEQLAYTGLVTIFSAAATTADAAETKTQFLGLGEISDTGELRPRRLLATA